MIEPLERGCGHTLGNAQPRAAVLDPGFAITEVKSTACCTSTPRSRACGRTCSKSLLNLKDVAIRMHNGDSDTLELKKQGPGIVTAGDIKTSHNVEVLNPTT